MATKGNRISVSVYLDPQVYEALRKLSEKTGAPISHYIREGTQMALEKYGVKVPEGRRNG